MQELVERAVKWHRGELSANENLSNFAMHVAGPKLHDGSKNPTRFHTYACLYPELGRYVAMNTNEWSEWPDCTINAMELREVVASLTIPPEKIQQQRAVAAEYLGSGVSAQFCREMALAACAVSRLPVGMLVVGNTAATSERVVYMHTVAVAPLTWVATQFKEAAPQINFN